MKTQKILISAIVLLSLLLMYHTGMAQKKYITDDREVVEAAESAIEQSMVDGEFKKFADKSGIKGSFTMDITIRGKGEVTSVKTIEREGDAMDQNKLKDFVISYRFPFKMPKDRGYKFRYEFKF